MNKRIVILIGLAVAILCVIVLLRKKSPVKTGEPFPPATQSASNLVGAVSMPTVENKPWVRPPGLDNAGWKYLSMVREGLLHKNQPIEFYARVIDQNDAPVPDAKLKLRLTRADLDVVLAKFPHMEMGDEISIKQFERMADADGWIQFFGAGSVLDVMGLTKDGYLSSYPDGCFGGVHYEPNNVRTPAGDILMTNAWNPNVGYTFHLWKKGATEKLVPISIGACFPNNEHQAWFDLFKQQVRNPSAEWADFTIIETLLHPEDPAKQYDRTIRIQGLHGNKLVETSQPYPYRAVETGYLPEYTFDVLPSVGYGNRGTWDWSKNFYVMARGGKVHGGLRVDFNGGKLCFGFTGHLNPTGSRNLEPDPDKLITDPAEIQKLDEATRVK